MKYIMNITDEEQKVLFQLQRKLKTKSRVDTIRVLLSLLQYVKSDSFFLMGGDESHVTLVRDGKIDELCAEQKGQHVSVSIQYQNQIIGRNEGERHEMPETKKQN